MDIEKLKAIATAATGGDWVIDGEVINEHGHLLQIYVGKAGAGRVGAVFANCTVTDGKCRANAEFMAEARPAVVLELIAEIERLGRNNEMWKDQVERQAKALEAQRGLLQRGHEAHRTTWTQLEQAQRDNLALKGRAALSEPVPGPAEQWHCGHMRMPDRKNVEGLRDPVIKRAAMAYNEALEDIERLNKQAEPGQWIDPAKERAALEAAERLGLQAKPAERQQ